jgi:hypothetical protein
MAKKRPPRPGNARELWGWLVRVFPDFANDCTREELSDETTLHVVMIDFASYFGSGERFSQAQIKSVGAFVNEAVMADDDLENAVCTCFLEHLRQSRGCKALAPHLSPRAKAKTHA